MTRKTLFSFASMVALAGAMACSDGPTSVPSLDADAELAALMARAEALQTEAGVRGVASPAVQIKLAELSADINAWRQRTGRTDATVETRIPSGDRPDVAFAIRGGGGGGKCVVACPAVTREGNRYCFLESGTCENGMQVCVYTCITFGLATRVAVAGKSDGGVAR